MHAENLEVCGKLIMFRLLAHHANSKFFKLLPIELVNQTGCFRIVSKSKLFCSCFFAVEAGEKKERRRTVLGCAHFM